MAACVLFNRKIIVQLIKSFKAGKYDLTKNIHFEQHNVLSRECCIYCSVSLKSV